MNIVLVFLTVIYTFVFCEDTVEMKFSLKSVVPEVLNRPPIYPLTADFNSTKFPKFGNYIHPKYVSMKPVLYLPTYVRVPNNLFASLIMVNADYPNRRNPKHRNMLHWMKINFVKGNHTTGEEKVEYVPVIPKKGSGQHRIVLLLYLHPTKIVYNVTNIKINSPESLRYNFSVKEFEKKNNLKEPFAGNFFKCSYHYG